MAEPTCTPVANQTPFVDRSARLQRATRAFLGAVASAEDLVALDKAYHRLAVDLDAIDAAVTPELCIYCSRHPKEPGSDYCFDPSCAILASCG